MRLVSHVNADGDLIQAWLDHYVKLGVSSFHLIVHGPRSENARLFELVGSYPIQVEQSYQGEFLDAEKRRRLAALLARLRGQWLVLVDSDEFLELPLGSIQSTVRALRWLGSNVLAAPMVQRLSADGSLDCPEVIADPFRSFPLCSVDLYQQMGVTADTEKFPLFWCGEATTLVNGGNHASPNGRSTALSPLQGVTHHFKWRRAVLSRLARRIDSSHPWRHESVGYRRYLEQHESRVPTETAFVYSREELLRRGLLKSATVRRVAGHVLARTARRIPGAVAVARGLRKLDAAAGKQSRMA
jgi:hypothetical protein